MEIIIGGDRRRKWSRELKAQITEESFAPGANVALTARRHGVSVGLLHYWRRCARKGAQDETLRFVPVLAGAPSEPNAAPPGSIEVELGGPRSRWPSAWPMRGASLPTSIRRPAQASPPR